MEFHKMWIEQCEATRGIQGACGTAQVMGYLVGENLLEFLDVTVGI